MSRRAKSRDVVDHEESFVVFRASARKRQADVMLDAFDLETEALLSGADRVIQWYKGQSSRKPKASLHPRRGGLAAAAKQRALRGKSASARNWVQGVRY